MPELGKDINHSGTIEVVGVPSEAAWKRVAAGKDLETIDGLWSMIDWGLTVLDGESIAKIEVRWISTMRVSR